MAAFASVRNLSHRARSIFAMPALPHPLTLEDRALAAHRWQARREARGQSLFLVAAYAVLAWLTLAAWLRHDAGWIASTLAWIHGHAVALAVAALVVSGWTMRRLMAADARRHARSSHAALPIWREMQRQRDTRLRWRFALQLSGALVCLAALVALQDVVAAWTMLDGLRWSWLAAVLALVFVPPPRRSSEGIGLDPPRLARAPAWLHWLDTPALPHLPQWWWQRAGASWMRGRAASALAFGLLVAPSEAAAIVVPVTLLMLMALANGLDIAHRLAGDVSQLLAERPPHARRIWRCLLPLHLLLALSLVSLVLALMHALGLGPLALALLAAALCLTAQIDLLLALLLRQQAARLGLVRVQCAVVAAALASAFPPLLPVAAAGLWLWLMRRVWTEAAHA